MSGPIHQVLDRPMLEDVCDGDLGTQQLTHTVSKTYTDNRVTSQLKEVVGEADPGDLESLLPQGTQRVLLVIARSHVLVGLP